MELLQITSKIVAVVLGKCFVLAVRINVLSRSKVGFSSSSLAEVTG